MDGFKVAHLHLYKAIFDDSGSAPAPVPCTSAQWTHLVTVTRCRASGVVPGAAPRAYVATAPDAQIQVPSAHGMQEPIQAMCSMMVACMQNMIQGSQGPSSSGGQRREAPREAPLMFPNNDRANTRPGIFRQNSAGTLQGDRATLSIEDDVGQHDQWHHGQQEDEAGHTNERGGHPRLDSRPAEKKTPRLDSRPEETPGPDIGKLGVDDITKTLATRRAAAAQERAKSRPRKRPAAAPATPVMKKPATGVRSKYDSVQISSGGMGLPKGWTAWTKPPRSDKYYHSLHAGSVVARRPP